MLEIKSNLDHMFLTIDSVSWVNACLTVSLGCCWKWLVRIISHTSGLQGVCRECGKLTTAGSNTESIADTSRSEGAFLEKPAQVEEQSIWHVLLQFVWWREEKEKPWISRGAAESHKLEKAANWIQCPGPWGPGEVLCRCLPLGESIPVVIF